MRYRVLNRQEIEDVYQRTGRGVDRFAEIRPDVERCIDSDSVWYNARINSTFLERRWWTDQRVLLHAAMVHFIAQHQPGLTREISRGEFVDWLTGYCQRSGIVFNPTWTPFDVDLCPGCNQPLPPYQFGRPRGYCSDACKMRAYRKRKTLTVTKVNRQALGV